MQQALAESRIKPSVIENVLNWRNATKSFDTRRVPDEEFNLLLETLRLSPSSINMQPWKFVVVNNKAVRAQLQQLAVNQAQVTEASHLILICSLKTIDSNYYDRLVKLEKEQNSGRSVMESFKPMAMSFIEMKSKEQLREWMSEQCYLALGFLLATCAMMQIDACPIEGFDHARVNKLLDLHQQGLESRVLVAIGYRQEEDEYNRKKKLRWPKEDVVITI